MEIFKSSDLTHKRSEVMKAARDGGALIQLRETNGEVREEFVLIPLTEGAIWSLYQSSEQGLTKLVKG